MKITKPYRILVLVLCSLCAWIPQTVLSQDNSTEWTEKNIYPESPRAWEFRHVSMPIPSLATGAATFNVGIYDLNVHDFSLPVKLTYCAGGIKVDAEYAPVGYGWSLLPSLRTTRKIMGRPDECFPKCTSQVKNDYGMQYQSITSTYATEKNEINLNPDKDDKYRYDPEHDIFTIHLPDKSITAIYDSGTLYAPGCKEYKLECDDDITYIKVTDPLGRVYNFDETGTCNGTDMMRTEWLLTSITLPSRDKIKINWSQPFSRIQQRFWNANYAAFDSNLDSNPGISTSMIDNLGMSAETNFFNDKNLNSIEFPGGKIEFSYKSYIGLDMLESIIVKDLSGNIVKKAVLGRGTSEYESKLLGSITVSGEGTYTFEYDNHHFEHPDGRDLWGFYNGKSNSYALSPSLTIKQSSWWRTPYPKEIPGANRADDYEYIQANMLKKATYPTGGICEWEYEPHRFKTVSPKHQEIMELIGDTAMSCGGGLRVKRMALYKKVNDPNPIIQEFEYGWNGNGLGNCISAPLLSTFISIENRAHATWTDGRIPTTFEDKLLTVNRRSNYMDYKYSTSPIWYDSIMIKYNEGRELHIFKEIIPQDAEMSSNFTIIPTNLNRVFSQGIQEVRIETQKNSGAGFKTVKVQSFAYESTGDGYYWGNYKIHRNWIQNGNKDFAPDFSFKGLCYYLDENLTFDGTFLPVEALLTPKSNAYSVYTYTIEPYYERLVSKTTEEFTSNGTVRGIEQFQYKPSTNLVCKKTIGDGTNEMSIEYSYAEGQSASVKAEMEEANVVGLVTSAVKTFKGAKSGYKMDISRISANVFCPVKVWKIRDNVQWTYTHYSYDGRGNMTEADGIYDGLVRRWTWDALGIYPLSESVGTLKKTAEWKSLVGVASLTDAAGIKNRFEYDSEGRLVSVYTNSKIREKYSYRINQDGNNMLTSTKMLSSAGGNVKTQRFDGLGRLWGDFDKINGNYVGVLTQYDDMDRVWRVWAPVSVSSSDVTEGALSSAAKNYYGDTRPFNEKEYEESPYSMVEYNTKAGSSWAGHPAETKRLANGSSSYSCLHYSVSGAGVKNEGYYKAGELSVSASVDEDGVSTETYTDFRGLQVCKKIGNDAVYYVYDEYGDLRYVLPPGLSGTMSRSDSRMKKLAYWYDYDSHGNLISKHLPGVGEWEYKYDPAGRLVAEHTIDHPAGSWRLYGYDNCGRRVIAMDISTGDAQASAWASACRTAVVSSGGDGAYSFSPSWSGVCTVVWANYYDTYDFIAANSLGADFSFKSGVISSNGTSVSVDARLMQPKGLQTGCYTGAGFEVYYYNNEGLRIQSYATGYNQGRCTETYTYDGQPSHRKITYDSSSPLKDMDVVFTYDGGGRLIKKEVLQSAVAKASSTQKSGISVHWSDTATVSCSYSPLGLLEKETFGNGSYIKRKYDVHGWIKSRDYSTGATSFSEELTYADGSWPCYNGNISSKTWRGHRYDYRYDSRNRLTSASYHSITSSSNKANFSTSYAYDERSSLVEINRKGVVGLSPLVSIESPEGEVYGKLDGITVDYDGNRPVRYANSCDGDNYPGRVGVGVLEKAATITYDYAGRVCSDSGRGIEQIDYNNDGLPTAIYFTEGAVHLMSYDGLGRHLTTKCYEPVKSVVIGGGPGALKCSTSREYYGDGQIVENGSLAMSRYGGGYFDSDGSPFYYFSDYQGNNISVVDNKGNVCQSTDYYPYGEVWRLDNALTLGTKNTFLYSDKEYLSMDGLHEYDFSARRQTPAVPGFNRMDTECEKYYDINPYVFCAGNPVNAIDPSGKLTIFINGFHFGDGESAKYWGGFDKK